MSPETRYAEGPEPELDWSRVRRVLLIRLRSIGDTVLMTPCLAALKALNKGIETTVVSEPLSAPVLEGHPFVDRLIIASPSLTGRARLVKRLRAASFDVAFNMHGGTTATTLAALSGARRAAGYRGHRQSWMLGARAPSPDLILGRSTLHSVEQQLALLKWTGVPYPQSRPRLSLAVSARAKAAVSERLQSVGPSAGENPGSGFAVIAPAAAMESKRWPAEGFAAAADHLVEHHGLASIVIAAPGQEHIAREVISLSRTKPALINGLSLQELIALLKLARFFVGNDSGPMHIAAAHEVPLVAIFGSSNPAVWHPWTESPYRVLKGEPVDRVLAADCLGAITELMGVKVGTGCEAVG